MTGYLLSVAELDSGAEAWQLLEEAIQKLDAHRLDKVNRLKVGKVRNQAVGAGLLLQLAAQERVLQMQLPQGQISRKQDIRGEESSFERLALRPLLERLGEPMQIAYSHGPKGKPDFVGEKGHFNLSHSGEFVCAVFDRNEIGVDIQWVRPLQDMRLANRYFSEREREALASCVDQEEQEKLFYRIWVKKESYAKLTGEGIAAVLEQDTFSLSRQVIWQEREISEGYCIAVCQYRKENYKTV